MEDNYQEDSEAFHIGSSYNGEMFVLLCLVLASNHYKQVLITHSSMASDLTKLFNVEKGAHILYSFGKWMKAQQNMFLAID